MLGQRDSSEPLHPASGGLVIAASRQEPLHGAQAKDRGHSRCGKGVSDFTANKALAADREL